MEPSPRRRLSIALFALAAALLACIGGAPGDSPTEAASFVTVTPGGRISVSLLTPTPAPQDALAGAATPIGPVATATAAAIQATSSAMTATASAPTPTVPGIFAPPAECPAPDVPPLPNEPASFSRYDEVIASYLSAGGAVTVLEGRLRSWGALTDYGGLVRADRDFTGDGVPEVLIVLLNPQAAEFPYPGDLYIFGCDGGAYRLLYQAGYAADRSAPIIANTADGDVNGNFLNDLVYAYQTCDGPACYTGLEIVEWNLTLNSFDSLLDEQIDEPAAEVQVVDAEDDGVSEVIVTSGELASEAAGPQRERTVTLRWDGARYVVTDIEPGEATYRIHVIHDGDAALYRAEYATAAALYEQALSEDLQSWEIPDEAAYLTAFARFRLIQAYAAAENFEAAQAAYDALIQAYSPPTPAPTAEGEGEGETPEGEPTITPTPALLSDRPGGAFVEMARLFWREYEPDRNIIAACEVVRAYALADPSSYSVLNDFGYANPTYTAPDLCPFGEVAPDATPTDLPQDLP
jgi:tetratricopeptide (TPR) repeat protein